MFQSPPTNTVADYEKEHETMSNFAQKVHTPPSSAQVGPDSIVLNEEDHATQKQQRVRFTPEEDKILIQSWLNISKDAVVRG